MPTEPSGEIETLHIPFAKWLRGEGIPFVNARPDRESTIAEGHPDFTLLFGGRTLLIEFKTKDGKTSAKQDARMAALRAAGNFVHVLRDLTRAQLITAAWRDTIGEAAAPLPATPGPTRRLVRFGASVFACGPGGALTHVRVATAADAHLAAA